MATTAEAQHLHRAQDLCRELAAKIVDHVCSAKDRGDPSPNALALLALGSLLAGDFDPQCLGLLEELEKIDGAAELRHRAAAEIRRAADGIESNQLFGCYHAIAGLLEPDRTWAIVRLIQGGKECVQEGIPLEYILDQGRRSG